MGIYLQYLECYLLESESLKAGAQPNKVLCLLNMGVVSNAML